MHAEIQHPSPQVGLPELWKHGKFSHGQITQNWTTGKRFWRTRSFPSPKTSRMDPGWFPTEGLTIPRAQMCFWMRSPGTLARSEGFWKLFLFETDTQETHKYRGFVRGSLGREGNNKSFRHPHQPPTQWDSFHYSPQEGFRKWEFSHSLCWTCLWPQASQSLPCLRSPAVRFLTACSLNATSCSTAHVNNFISRKALAIEQMSAERLFKAEMTMQSGMKGMCKQMFPASELCTLLREVRTTASTLLMLIHTFQNNIIQLKQIWN